MSMFDPNAFLDLEITEAFERRPALPVRDYPTLIQEVTARQWTSKDKYNDNGTLKSGVAYDLTLVVQVPLDIKEQIGLKTDTLTIKDSVMVDLNANGGSCGTTAKRWT